MARTGVTDVKLKGRKRKNSPPETNKKKSSKEKVSLNEVWTARLQNFIELKTAQQRSERTLEDYRKHVTQFFSRYPGAMNDEKSLRRDAMKYMSQKIKPATYNLRLSNLGAFFDYCCRESELEKNPLQELNRVKDPGHFKRIPDEIIMELLEQPDRSTFVGRRDFAFMLLSIDTGIRPSEALQLRIENVDFAHRKVELPAHVCKTREKRELPFCEETKVALEELLSARRNLWGNSVPLFSTCNGTPLSDREWSDRMGVYSRKISKKIRPYDMRHFFSQAFLRNEGDVFSLKKILGHRSLEMTQRYISLSSDDVEESHKKASPAHNLFGRKKESPRQERKSASEGFPSNDRPRQSAAAALSTQQALMHLFKNDPTGFMRFVGQISDFMALFSQSHQTA